MIFDLNIFPWVRKNRDIRKLSRSELTSTADNCITFRNRYYLRPRSARKVERYVVCADLNPIYSGLGCMIRILAPCWMYARETGRTLVIDWRGNPYTRNEPSLNLFASLFDPISVDRAGIPVISNDSVNELRFPQPLLTTSESMEFEDGSTARMPNGGLDHDALAEIIANCTDVDCPTVLPSLPSVFRITRRWILPEKIRLTDEALRHCYGMLRPRAEWRKEAESFYAESMRGLPLIGLHIRHGNGEGNFRSHFRRREITEYDAFMEQVAQVVKHYGARRFNGNYTVFIATDSDHVIGFLKSRFPRLVTRSIRRPSEGCGVDFDHAYRGGTGSGIRSAADALVDMLLLAKCDAVMITRFTSFAWHVRYTLEQPDAEFIDDEQFARLADELKS